MALCLKGRFAGFYQAGASECVRDTWRCYPSNNKLSILMTRRDMESVAKRFWKYESTTITFYPLNDQEPRLGGKVQAKVMGMDFQTFTPYSKTYHGVYGDDFVSYGTFKSNENPRDCDETLLKLFDDADREVTDQHNFKFANNTVTYSRQVCAEHNDAEIEHAIQESVLSPHIDQTWSESLFYGAGNKTM